MVVYDHTLRHIPPFETLQHFHSLLLDGRGLISEETVVHKMNLVLEKVCNDSFTVADLRGSEYDDLVQRRQSS